MILQEAKGKQPAQGARNPRSKASLYDRLDCGDVVQNMLFKVHAENYLRWTFIFQRAFCGMILKTALQELVAELLVSPTPGEDPNSDIRENSLRCLASCLTEVENAGPTHASGQSQTLY